MLSQQEAPLALPLFYLQADANFTGWKLSAAGFCDLEGSPTAAFTSSSWLVFKNAEMLVFAIGYFFVGRQAVLWWAELSSFLGTCSAVLCRTGRGETVTFNCLFLIVNKYCSSTSGGIYSPAFLRLFKTGTRSGPGFLPLVALLFMILINRCQMSWERVMRVERPLFQPTIDLN